MSYWLDIFVPTENISRANERIQPGTMIQIRHADLNSKAIEGKDGPIIFTTVSTKWNWIEFLTRYPNKEKQ